MAEKLGVDRKKLRDLEKGKLLPDSELIWKMSYQLYVPFSLILKDSNGLISEICYLLEQLEADKTAYLKGIAENTNVDISGIVSDITSGIEQSGNGITRTLSEIIDAIHGIKMEQQNYTDSRQINITTSDAAVMSRFMGAM